MEKIIDFMGQTMFQFVSFMLCRICESVVGTVILSIPISHLLIAYFGIQPSIFNIFVFIFIIRFLSQHPTVSIKTKF